MTIFLVHLDLSKVGQTSVPKSRSQGEGGVAEDGGHGERSDLRELHTLLTSHSTAGADSVPCGGLGREADHRHSHGSGGLSLLSAEDGHEAGLASDGATCTHSIPCGGQERAGDHGERVRAGGGHQEGEA